MPAPQVDLTDKLKRLLEQIMHEADPLKYDQLGLEIWRVLDEIEGQRMKRLRSDTGLFQR